MSNIEKTKMVVDYLDRFYSVRKNRFYDLNNNAIWGVDILREIHDIFGFNYGLICDMVKKWGENKGIDDWEKARGRELKYETGLPDYHTWQDRIRARE